MAQLTLDEQKVLNRCDATTDPFCRRAELVVWSVGCTIGALIGILLTVSGCFNVGENIDDAIVRVVFGLAVIGFCGVLMRCKYVELWKKFGATDANEMFLRKTLDPRLIEAEWRRYRKLLAKASALKGVSDGS